MGTIAEKAEYLRTQLNMEAGLPIKTIAEEALAKLGLKGRLGSAPLKDQLEACIAELGGPRTPVAPGYVPVVEPGYPPEAQPQMMGMQQMQVTVPDGVEPGMAFQVNTPSGVMQVVCPESVSAGGKMLVNIPESTPAVAAVVTAVVQPHAPQPEQMVMAEMPVAPVSNQMSRAATTGVPMSGRMVEVQDGCYYQTQAPCCNMFYFMFDRERTQYMTGPGCCLCIFCCPFPGLCGTYKEVEGKGSATYSHSGSTDRWQTPTSFLRHGNGMPDGGAPFSKC